MSAEADELNKLAWAAIDGGKYPDGIDLATRAEAHDPENPQHPYARGIAKLRSGDATAAEAEFEAILKRWPDFREAVYSRAYTRQMQARYEVAIADYTAFLAGDPDNAEAIVNRGLCRLFLKDGAGAFADFDRAAALLPQHADVPFQRARARMNLGQLDEAIVDFERARSLGCTFADLDYYLAVIRSDQKKFAEALADVDRYLAKVPDGENALLQKGWILRQLGQHENAIRALTEAIAVNSNLASAWSNRGYAKRDLGLKIEAAADFRRALELNPAWAGELNPFIEAAPAPAPLPPPIAPPAPRPVTAPPPQPAPPPAPETRGAMVLYAAFGIAVFIVLGILNIPVLSALPKRTIDVPYKAWFIFQTWPDKDVCMEPFCTRTDTDKEHAWGRPGYTSEQKLSYCPEHEPGFMDSKSRIDGCFTFWYFLFCIGATGFLLAGAGMMLLRIIAWPVLIPMWLQKKIPADYLLPGVFESSNAMDRNLSIAGGVVGAVAAGACWLMYMYW